jgi:hypothetical protein
MFNFKKQEQKDCFANKVKCQECKCWLDECDAYKTELKVPYSLSTRSEFYCFPHRKKYNEIHYHEDYPEVSNLKYFGSVEMDEEGNPIKKK